jgi:ABC-type multidrug transport system fused ATPase/permease subunit
VLQRLRQRKEWKFLRLVERGTHAQLMAKDGQYASLFGIQAAAYR